MFEQIVLRLAHCLLTLGIFVRQLTSYFIHFGLAYKQKSSVDVFRNDARHLKKLPIHLGIVVLEEKLSYTDIANIVIWSLALGISCISIYDVNGEFKRNHSLLRERMAKRQKEVFSEDSNKYSICIHSSGLPHSDIQNGFCSKIDLQILSPEDGRQQLVKLARSLSQDVVNSRYRLEDINPQNIDSILQGQNRYPDPDLVIKFGIVDSLLGFLPWQIRLTEILSHPTHCSLSYKVFVTLLHSFGDTQQRFGR